MIVAEAEAACIQADAARRMAEQEEQADLALDLLLPALEGWQPSQVSVTTTHETSRIFWKSWAGERNGFALRVWWWPGGTAGGCDLQPTQMPLLCCILVVTHGWLNFPRMQCEPRCR